MTPRDRVRTAHRIARARARLRWLEREVDKKIVAAAPCRLCASQPGQRCTTIRGKRVRPHVERRFHARFGREMLTLDDAREFRAAERAA